MEQVAAYKATDGKLFGTIEECQEHEFSLVWRERINEFLTSPANPYPAGTHRGMVIKTVLAWEQYKTA